MRTPNTECVICGKPLYRRPSQMKKTRFSACMKHRAKAQVVFGQTEAQKKALELGREKGTNHLEGMPKSEESNRKRSKSISAWCRDNPEKCRERVNRGPSHYRWNGGSSKLNTSIRQMTEHRRWMDAVKNRDDYKCLRCGSEDELESHHIKEFSVILEENEIETRDQARKCQELWDIDNGITLCRKCHYKEHGRTYAD